MEKQTLLDLVNKYYSINDIAKELNKSKRLYNIPSKIL